MVRAGPDGVDIPLQPLGRLWGGLLAETDHVADLLFAERRVPVAAGGDRKALRGEVNAGHCALEGITKLLNTIKIVKKRQNPKLEIEGFLLTMYDSRLRLANQIYDEVKRHFQELVFKTVIQRNVKLSESPSHGLPVILYDAESAGAKNYLALAKEIISKNS